MTVYVGQLSLLNALCLCPTDGEVKHNVDIGNRSSVEIVNEFGYLWTCYLWMEMLMLL